MYWSIVVGRALCRFHIQTYRAGMPKESEANEDGMPDEMTAIQIQSRLGLSQEKMPTYAKSGKVFLSFLVRVIAIT